MYARTGRMMMLAGAFLLLAAPAQAARFSLVEMRPAARPFLALTGAAQLDPSIGLWRVPSGEVRQLGQARLVRLAEPERRLAPARVADEPLLGYEWWLAAVGATKVVAPGPGVPVAVVDTGLDISHPEFESRPNTVALNTQSVVDSIQDFHGTAVSSVIGAPVNGVGMVGIYPQASLYAYDADLSGALTVGQLIEGISEAAQVGRVVINLSLGSTHFDQALEDAVYAAYRSGALIVAAAGNSGESGVLNYPANFPHVLTVGATDQSGYAAVFSSASQGVDLAAPGVGITGAVPYRFSSDGYQLLDGTSFSAPIVSGGAALVWTVRSDLDNTQLFDLLRFSARDVSTHGFDPETGFGILDLPNALAFQAPIRDPEEPNDDVRLVRPGGLFPSGTPPLTTRTKPKASLHASLDVSEDPVDLYRLWVPANATVTLAARSNPSVRVRVWGPETRSIAESGTAARRDLAASGVSRVSARNTSKRAAYFYADVRLAHGVRDGTYELSVATSASAKP